MNQEQTLTQRQQALIPVASFAAAGDLDALDGALRDALNAGMTVNDGKEVLVQLYAYAGFPRSLNALGTFMKVVEDRKARASRTPLATRRPAPFRKGMNCSPRGPPTRPSWPANR